MKRTYPAFRLSTCLIALAVLLAETAVAQTHVRSVTGPTTNARFGKACVEVADQNGDGYKDLLIGAPGFNQERGSIWCLSGAYVAFGTGIQMLWSLAPTANQGDLFGFAIAGVGDCTGDGIDDFLVGQPGYDVAGSNDVGAVRLVAGGSHAVLSTIRGSATGGLLGSSLATTGDVDLDGITEVLIGAPGTGMLSSDVYLLQGSRLTTSDAIGLLAAGFLPGNGGEELGTSIAAGFDFVDFGTFARSSFVIGAPGYNGAGAVDGGRLLLGSVTFGGSTITINDSFVSSTPGERLGSSVDAAHDYDGDGRVDIVAGAPNAPDGSGNEGGRVYVLSGLRLANQTPPYEIHTLSLGFGSPVFDLHFGAAVRASGDLNNDGVGDILVGAPDYTTLGGGGSFNNWGVVSVFSGSSGARWANIFGASTDRFGDSLTGAIQDLDGDGFKEFVAAGSLSGAGGIAAGVVKCYRLFPMAPATYCTGKVNSLGCTPAIGFSGTPSSAALAPFLVTCSNVISDRSGIFFYSHRPTAAAFQGGFLCVLAPVIRTAIQNSGGTPGGGDCLGTYSFDFNDWIVNGFDSSLSTGAEIYGQHWARDPQSPSTTSLSNALRFLIHP